MKKLLKSCLVVMLTLLFSNAFSQTEMNYWSLPPYKVNFTGSSPAATNLPVLDGPSAVYSNGWTYIADQMNHSIRYYNSGSFTDVAGNGIAGLVNGSTPWQVEFNQPAGIVMDGVGNLFVSDKVNNVIRKINSSNVVTTFAGSGTAALTNGTGAAAAFNQPEGLAIDGSGNIYVADNGNHAIRKITSSGVVTTVAGSGFAGFVNGTGGSAQFRNPSSVVLDGSGNIYVADFGNNCIRKLVISTQAVTTFAGSTSGTAGFTNGTGTGATFSGPYGITLDASSNLYVSEKVNNSIRKIVISTQVVTTFAGGTSGSANGTGTSAQFNAPAGLFFDGSNILVADYGNNSIRQITTGAVVTTQTITGTSYIVSNSTYDGSGNILFSIKDDYILDATGTTAGRLTDNGSLASDLGNDVEIVPVPTTCRNFYIIFSRGTGSTSDLLYTQVSVSGAGVVSIVNDGLTISSVGGNYIATAVGPLVSGSRKLYALSTSALYQHSITSSGIFSGTTMGSVTGDAFDMDLSPDATTLAWSSRTAGGSTATVNLTPTSSPYTNVTKTISVGSYGGCYGVEFSADNLSLYLSLNSSVTANQGIYKLNISAGTSAIVTGTSGHYGTTQLEIAGDGYLYAIDGNSSPAGLLGRVSTSGTVTNGVLTNPILSNQTTATTSSLYRLPDQIHGENYSYFFGVAKPNTTFTINGTATSPTSAVNTYTCSTITLGSLASAATAYTITVSSADASGNIVAGYSYTTGLVSSTPPATINVQALNSSYLAGSTHTGYFLITYYAQNSCANTTTAGLIQNSTISTASANFQMNDGLGNSYPYNHTLSGDLMCTGGVSVSGSYSTGYIATYQITVDQVNPTTGATITANIVNTTPTNVPSGNPANITAVSLNTKSSPRNYFITNTGTFKLTFTVTNACGSSSQYGYFYVDGSCRLAAPDVAQVYKKDAAYPNPSNGPTTITFNSDNESNVKLTLMPMQGNNLYTVVDNKATVVGANDLSFDTTNMPTGIYLYQVSDDTHTIQTGKLVVTK